MIKSRQLEIIKVHENTSSIVEDNLAIEEPLEIRLSFIENGKAVKKPISVTMSTPGNEVELSIGFLYTEGIIQTFDQVSNVEVSLKNDDQVVTVFFKENVKLNLTKLDRNFYTTSSCGVCGKSSIDAIKIVIPDFGLENLNSKIHLSLIYSLPEKLKVHQNIFNQTGGLHASAIFNLNGDLIILREDVGRHNALDKLIGSCLMNDKIPLNDSILLLSGRASFELIQKASMAGIKIIVAIGAPSSLAVELAKECNITLIGFLKSNQFNIYSLPDRIDLNKKE